LLVAESGGRIVGLRAFMRWKLIDADGGELRCVRPVDTATHPSYQRRGIFRTLTEEAVELARDGGVDLIFNTPNPQSGAGYLRMGWEAVGPIGVLLRPKLSAAWFGTQPTIPSAGTMLPEARPVDTRTLPEARQPRGLRTPRTEEYLTWRFTQRPGVAYVVQAADDAAIVVHPGLRNGRAETVVSEMIGDASSALLRRLIGSAKSAYVVGWFSQGSPERAAALRAGMLPVPGVKALTLVVRPLSDRVGEVTNLRRWDLALSDLELL
jgi:hypothetical protein